jgi:protein-S-isoprenylcysteine O-methyltransferase Ste14
MNDTPPPPRPLTPAVRRVIIKWITQATLGLVGYGLVLFLSAGTLAWVWAWLFLGVLAVYLMAHPLILAPRDPELLAERQKGFRDQGVKTWDKWINWLNGLLMMASWVVAGLDFRFGWTGPVPLACHIGGLAAVALGFALFLWAMMSNPFFSEGVRIQEERGHVVARGGPYRMVRHPGYVGAILAQLGTPFLLGSSWAMIPSLVLGALMVTRTWLEDRTLLQELPGYGEYTQRTRFRLLPGVW